MQNKVDKVNKQLAIATGMDRYISITKRKRSPPPPEINQQTKKNKNKNDKKSEVLNSQVAPNALTNNRFAPLSNLNDKEASSSNQAPKELKPPPIYLRERSSNVLIASLARLVGNENFYVTALTRGNMHETKIQVKSEDKYRIVVKEFETNNKNFYTYQLKSSKGLTVVIKGIDPDVDPNEIKDALGDLGFHAKSVTNIINKKKLPQPMFRIELLPGTAKMKKNENHPIYNLQFLLHRRITVEAPHPRNGPVQCANCQEYGHTKKYCTLRSVCVICAELHPTSECPNKKKDDSSIKKCGNCHGNHTANYRGCLVYQHLKRNMALRRQSLRNRNVNTLTAVDFVPQQTNSNNVTPGFSYADVLNSGAPTQQKNHFQTNNNLEVILSQFMNSMQSMLDKVLQLQSQLMSALLKQK